MIFKASLLIVLVGFCHGSRDKLECRDKAAETVEFLKTATYDFQIPLGGITLTIDPLKKNIGPNDVFVVRLSGLTEEYSNFMIQAKDKAGNIVGEFINEKSGIKIVSCEGSKDTALNTEPAPNFDLTWRAPASYPKPDGSNKTTFNFFYQIKEQKQPTDKQNPWKTQYKVEKSSFDLDYYSGASSPTSTALLATLIVAMAKLLI